MVKLGTSGQVHLQKVQNEIAGVVTTFASTSAMKRKLADPTALELNFEACEGPLCRHSYYCYISTCVRLDSHSDQVLCACAPPFD